MHTISLLNKIFILMNNIKLIAYFLENFYKNKYFRNSLTNHHYYVVLLGLIAIKGKT